LLTLAFGARPEAASAALANAFVRAVILPLNRAIELGHPIGLGKAGVRQSFAGRRQVILVQRLSWAIAGRRRERRSIPTSFLAIGRKS
jgi:hypothetical protein